MPVTEKKFRDKKKLSNVLCQKNKYFTYEMHIKPTKCQENELENFLEVYTVTFDIFCD